MRMTRSEVFNCEQKSRPYASAPTIVASASHRVFLLPSVLIAMQYFIAWMSNLLPDKEKKIKTPSHMFHECASNRMHTFFPIAASLVVFVIVSRIECVRTAHSVKMLVDLAASRSTVVSHICRCLLSAIECRIDQLVHTEWSLSMCRSQSISINSLEINNIKFGKKLLSFSTMFQQTSFVEVQLRIVWLSRQEFNRQWRHFVQSNHESVWIKLQNGNLNKFYCIESSQ